MARVQTAAIADPLNDWSHLRAAAPALLLGLLVLGLIFRPEVEAAVTVWSSSTAYNHCFLVLPIVAWLAYDRRQQLSGVPARPIPWVGLSLLPVITAWLISERLGIMEGRQLAAIAAVQLLFLSVLGWRLVWLLSAPLIYLVFLVPFGGFLTGTLQDFTAGFIVHGLNVLGIVNISDGNTIEIPEGIFFVAEACAGLRFLIASLAFGVLYAVTFYRTVGRRAIFILASMVVPIIANGVRALGIVVAGHWVGSAEAAAADHIIYGWLFFSTVTLLLIVAGLPFRQDHSSGSLPSLPRKYPLPSGLSLVSSALLLVVFASTGPLMARKLDREAAAVSVAALPTPTGCTPLRGDLDHDVALPAGARSKAFECDHGAVTLRLMAFSPGTNPMIILAQKRAAEADGNAEDLDVVGVSGAPGWRVISSNQPPGVAATALWLDGALTSGGLRSRLQQARDAIAGITHTPVVATVHAALDQAISQQRRSIIAYLSEPERGGPTVSAELAAFSLQVLAAPHDATAR